MIERTETRSIKELFGNSRWPIPEKPCPTMVELSYGLNTAFARVKDANPDATPLILYKLFAVELPFFTSKEIQKNTLEAIANPDPEIAKIGTNVFVLMNMRRILSAAEDYCSGDPDQDFDLLQAGITHLIGSIKERPTNKRGGYLYPYIRSFVQWGISQEISKREGIPTGWVMKKLHTQIIEMVTDSLDLIPSNPSGDVVKKLANEIASETGVEATAVESLIEYRVALRDSLSPQEQKEAEHHLEQLLENALGSLSPRLAVVLRARNGLSEEGRVYTQENAGKLVGVTRERARQLEDRGLRQLRFLMRSKKTIQKEAQLPPAIPEFPTNFSRLLGIPVDPVKMVYRYSTTGFYGVLDLTTARILRRNGIINVTDLLSRNTTELLEIEGINAKNVFGIIEAAKKFLEADCSKTKKTILEQWQ